MMKLKYIIDNISSQTDTNRTLCFEYIQNQHSIAPAYYKSILFFSDYDYKENRMIYYWFVFDYSEGTIVAMGQDYHDLLSDDEEYNEEDFSIVDEPFTNALTCFIGYIDANHINEVTKARRFLNSDNSQKKINNKRYKRV